MIIFNKIHMRKLLQNYLGGSILGVVIDHNNFMMNLLHLLHHGDQAGGNIDPRNCKSQ